MAKAAKKASGKRTTIAPKGDKRYIRRDAKGQIKESDDVGRSLSKDAQQHSNHDVKPGYGDQGDRKTTAAKKSASKKSPSKKVAAKKATAKKTGSKSGK